MPLYKKSGTGKTSMEAESITNSEDTVSLSIGKDLLSLLMSKDL